MERGVARVVLSAVFVACLGGVAERAGFTATRGGLGGYVVRVTTLENEGPGSLRAALSSGGARVAVFEVGGVIDLGRKTLKITEPFVTVAGETAPSPGITLIRGAVTVQTHDVVVRHLRIRPGDAGQPKGQGWEPDGLSVNADRRRRVPCGKSHRIHNRWNTVSWRPFSKNLTSLKTSSQFGWRK